MKMTSKKILSGMLILLFSISITGLAIGADSVPFTKAVNLGKEIRNNYDGFVGMKIKIGSKDIQITELGRFFEKTNKQSHELQIIDHKTNKILGKGTVDMSRGKADEAGFKYAALKTPVTAKANMEYDIVSKETLKGDTWYGSTTGKLPVLTVTNVAQVLTQISGLKPPFFENSRIANQCFVPVSFRYQSLK